MAATSKQFKVSVAFDAAMSSFMAGLKQAESGLKQLRAEMKQGEQSAQGMEGAAKRAGEAQAAAGKKAAAGLSESEKAAKRARHELDQLRQSAQDLNNTLGFLRNSAAVGLGALAGGLALVARNGLSAASTMQDLRASYEVMLGSKVKADRMMAEVVRFAAVTPFDLAQVASGAKLLGNLMLDGSDPQAVLRRLRAAGAAAAGTGVAGGVEQAIRSIQDAEAGQWSLAQMGPLGLSRQKAQELGIQFDQNGSLVTEGKRAAEIIEAYWLERFGSLFDKAAERWSGMVSNIRDNLFQRMAQIGERLIPAFKPLVDMLNTELSGPEFIKATGEAARELAEILRPLVDGASGWLSKTAAYLKERPSALAEALRSAAGIGKDLLAVVVALAGAQGILSLIQACASLAAMTGGAGPLGLAIVAATALLITLRSALGGTGDGLLQLEQRMPQTADRLDSLGEAVREMTTKWAELMSQVGDSQTPVDRGLAALQRLSDWITALQLRPLESLVQLLGSLPVVLDRIRAVASGNPFAPPLGSNAPASPPRAGYSNIGELRYLELDAPPGYGPKLPAPVVTAVDEKALAAAAKSREQLTAEAVGIVSEIGAPAARAAAEALTGLTDNTCAATLTQYLRGIGFQNVPDFRSTDDVLKWLRSIGATQIAPGSAQAGDIVFSKDRGGIRGMFDHVGLAVADASASGRISFADQTSSSRSEAANYFGAAWRIPTSQLASALGMAPNITSGESLLDRAIRAGLIDPITEMAPEINSAKRKLIEALEGRLSSATERKATAEYVAKLLIEEREFVGEMVRAGTDAQVALLETLVNGQMPTIEQILDAQLAKLDYLASIGITSPAPVNEYFQYGVGPDGSTSGHYEFYKDPNCPDGSCEPLSRWVEDDAEKKARPQRSGGSETARRIDQSGQMIGSALQLVAQIIEGGGQNILQAVTGFVAQLAGPQLGPIIGGLGAIFGALAGKKQRATPVEVVNEPVVHFARELGFGFAASPFSAAVRGAVLASGASFAPVFVIETTQEVGSIDKVATKVAQHQHARNFNSGRNRGGRR